MVIDVLGGILDQVQGHYDSFIFLDPICNLMHVLTVYFTFEFVHVAYLKICRKLHSYCYQKSISGYRRMQTGYAANGRIV